jgi:hypothetical protein
MRVLQHTFIMFCFGILKEYVELIFFRSYVLYVQLSIYVHLNACVLLLVHHVTECLLELSYTFS